MSVRIVIVGAGFCGAALAHHLARAGAGELVLVDRRGEFGPGLAYRTADPLHFLNTPAGRMSAVADDPAHFVRWARARDPAVDGGSFLPRGLYGDYLRELVAATGATCLTGQVVAVRPRAGAVDVHLADGRTLPADRVVLAPGNPPPAFPPGLPPELRTDPRWHGDPWTSEVPAGDAAILVLGTGLTALDVAASLRGRGHRGPVHLLSRRGLLAHAHRSPGRPPSPTPPPIDDWPATARATVRAIRRAVADARAAGVDWREVIADLRPVTQQLWRRWPPAERDRFVRHLRTFWEIHRHRAAPRTAADVAAMRAAGQLHVHAGRLTDLTLGPARLTATVRPRGGASPYRLEVDRIVNATGPATDPRRIGDPLLDDLIAHGLLTPDPLGAAIADDGAALDAHGAPSSWLFVLGALRRPQLWETTAVLELAPQAEALARRLL